jgi:hypothetical protein
MQFLDNSGNSAFIGANNGDFLVQTPSGGFSTKLTISNSGAATFSSSVTATELYLSTSNGLVGNINSSNANGGYLTWQTSGAVIADIGTTQQIFGSGGNDTFGINGRGARAIAFGTNNTERMRITSVGNVGIGTTTISKGKVQIAQSSTFDGLYVTNGLNGLLFYNDGSVNTIDATFHSTGSYQPLAFVTGGSPRMTITSGGLVGINNTNPNSNLHVTGSVAKSHVTKSANYTLNGGDYTVGFDCTGGDRTATLPDATTCTGRIYVIYQYNTGGSARGVLIDGNGSQTINGETLYYLKNYCEYTSAMIQSNGSNWIIIANAIQSSCL